MLAETEAELKEFQISSKELEEEMALDVERAEKAREDMENKLARIEGERDDWKVCIVPSPMFVCGHLPSEMLILQYFGTCRASLCLFNLRTQPRSTPCNES